MLVTFINKSPDYHVLILVHNCCLKLTVYKLTVLEPNFTLDKPHHVLGKEMD